MATHANSSSSFPAITTNQPESFQSDLHCEELLKNLKDRQDLYDVVLKTGDDSKRIRAHRLILIGSSEYFSSLLSGESPEREVTINDVDGDALEKLVNYCYTGKLEFEGNTIQGLFRTAKHLHLQKVVDGCCDFIQRHLSTSNCLAAVFFAEQQNIKMLFNSTKKFIGDSFIELQNIVNSIEKESNSPDFLLLNVELLKEFITSNELNVPSEEFLFEVIIKWIDCEPENRRKHFDELLSLLRLNRMPPTFLSEKVEPLCNTMESHKLVSNDGRPHLPGHTRNNQTKNILAISKRSVDGEENFTIDGYNFLTCKWTSYDTKIRYRWGCAVTLTDDKLIVVGGQNSAEVTSINLRTIDSTELAPLAKRRKDLQVAALNGSIYAIGGYDGKYCFNSVEKWDLATRKWNLLAPMKTTRTLFGVAVLNSYLYVSGGWNGERILASVECYDPVTNTWTERAPMKEGRNQHCLAAYKGNLFAIGGWGNTSTERYDPKTNTWSLISCSPPIEGSTLCTSIEKDVFILNNKKVYQIINESCENLKMEKLCGAEFENICSILCYDGELGKDYKT